MKKIKVVIVEDDNHDLNKLKSILELKNAEIEVVNTCSNVDEAIKLFSEEKPDLVFLDIELGTRKSFEILEHKGDLSYGIIFTTSHVNYAIKAFEANAVHYLHKPVKADMIWEAIKRFKQRTNTDNYLTNELLSIKNAIRLMLSPPSNDTKVRLEIGSEIIYRTLGEISVFQAFGELSKVFFVNSDRLTEDRSLKRLLEKFQLFPFRRVHKSYIINPYNIEKFTSKDGYHFIMKGFDGSVPLGRTFRQKIISELGL